MREIKLTKLSNKNLLLKFGETLATSKNHFIKVLMKLNNNNIY